MAFHERLMRSAFRATPGYLKQLAADLQIDGQQMIEDMESAAIADELETSAALGRMFGFVGTPALVIGKTVVLGQISEKQIGRIVELERKEGWSQVCNSI